MMGIAAKFWVCRGAGLAALLCAGLVAPAWAAAVTVAATGTPTGAVTATPTADCPADRPTPHFLADEPADMVALLPPPPSASEQAAELQAVLDAQAAAHAAGTTARAVADSEITCARFKDVLGPALKSPAAARALQFVSDAALNAALAAAAPKQYWKRPRPYVSSERVERLADVAPDGRTADSEYPVEQRCLAEAPPRDALEAAQRARQRALQKKLLDFSSYPSGHSTFGYACALLLAQIVPEQRAALLARGREYGESRMIVGAHYPADVQAGRTVAVTAVLLLHQNQHFEQLLAQARRELRAALGLPPELPDLEPMKNFFSSP